MQPSSAISLLNVLLFLVAVSANELECHQEVSFIQGSVLVSQVPELAVNAQRGPLTALYGPDEVQPSLDELPTHGESKTNALKNCKENHCGSVVTGWMSYGSISQGIANSITNGTAPVHDDSAQTGAKKDAITYISCILGLAFMLACSLMVKYLPKEVQEEASESEIEGAPEISSSTESKELLPVVMLWSITFSSYFAESIVLPFLPLHFADLGLTALNASMVFALLPLGVILCSPLAFNALNLFTRPKLLLAGVILQFVCTLALAYTDLLTGGEGQHVNTALMMYGLFRFLSGVGVAFANCSVLGIVAKARPDDFSSIMGWNEVIVGAAFSLGPVIGALLYARYDFACPLVVASVFQLLSMMPILALMCQSTEETVAEDVQQEVSISERMSAMVEDCPWGVRMAAFANFLACFYYYQMNANLETYLLYTVHVTESQAAIIFGLFSACFCAASPLFGYLADAYGPYRICMGGIVATGLAGGSFFSPCIEAVPRDWKGAYLAAALCITGACMAGVHVPVLSAMAVAQGTETETSVDSHAALFTMSLQLGACLGPVLGTLFIGVSCFEFATMLVGGLAVLFGLAALPQAFRFPAFRAKVSKRQRKLSGSKVPSTVSPKWVPSCPPPPSPDSPRDRKSVV